MREEVEELNKEVKVIKKQEISFALEMLSDYKQQNKRLFIIWLITFISFLCLLGYTIYLLNDVSIVTEQEIEQESSDGNNNFIGRDGNIG